MASLYLLFIRADGKIIPALFEAEDLLDASLALPVFPPFPKLFLLTILAFELVLA